MVDRFVELSLSNAEEEELILEVDPRQHIEGQYKHCLVGQFLTDRSINFIAMKNRIASIWGPGRGVCIKELGSQLYLFQFIHEVVSLRADLGLSITNY